MRIAICATPLAMRGRIARAAGSAALLAALAACGSAPLAPVIERDEATQSRSPTRAATPPVASASVASPIPASAPKPQAASRGGAYYKDDGPGDSPPPDLDRIADAQPRIEPLHRFANNPYNVFGKDYVPMRNMAPFRQSGMGSWYGRKFHGQRTSSGEVYDMYGMTAAHPTLPIPSYVRVSNQQNGRSVVVRVNDRGPFHAGRVIDLSFAAAFKLGYVIAGSAPVQVELLQAEEIARLAAQPGNGDGQAIAPRIAAAGGDGPGTAKTPPPAQNSVAATSTTTAPSTASAPPASSSGIYLQLGAFSARDNAESFRARVYRELAWLGDAIEILPREGIYRVHLGPYRDRNEAADMAGRLKRDIDLNPVYVTR